MRWLLLLLIPIFLCGSQPSHEASSYAKASADKTAGRLTDKELPKPMVIPKTVIIYPPQTAEEFLARKTVLRNVLDSHYPTRIIVKDKKPEDKNK